MKSLHGPHDGLHHLGFAANAVGGQWRDRNGVFRRCVTFAHDAEKDQRHGKHGSERNQLAASGFEEIEKIARFHGWPLGGRIGCTLGVLVTMVSGGGGDSRFTSTVKAFFRDSSLRPPSGVPVTEK
jgi:hypothetical protein